MSTADDNLAFMLARAMAKAEGNDPDMAVVPMGGFHKPGPYLIRGYQCAVGPTLQVWELYDNLARLAIEHLRKPKG